MKVHVIATDTKAAEDVELDFEFPGVAGLDQAHDNAVVTAACEEYGLVVHGWWLAAETPSSPTAGIPWEDGHFALPTRPALTQACAARAITVFDGKSTPAPGNMWGRAWGRNVSDRWPIGTPCDSPQAAKLRDHLKTLKAAIESRARQAADKARPLAWRLLFPTQPGHAERDVKER